MITCNIRSSGPDDEVVEWFRIWIENGNWCFCFVFVFCFFFGGLCRVIVKAFDYDDDAFGCSESGGRGEVACGILEPVVEGGGGGRGGLLIGIYT